MSVISSLRGGGVGQLWLWGPPEWHSQYRPDRNSLSPKKQTERNWLKSRLSIQMLPDLLFQVRRWDQQKCHLGLGGPASSPALPQSLKYGWAESTFCTLTSSKFRNRCPKEAVLRVKNTDVWTDLGGFPSSLRDTDLQPDWEQSPMLFPWTTSWVD